MNEVKSWPPKFTNWWFKPTTGKSSVFSTVSLGSHKAHTVRRTLRSPKNWPWLRVEVLLMSPEIKEDSDCFLTVSFHILLIRLYWYETARKAHYVRFPMLTSLTHCSTGNREYRTAVWAFSGCALLLVPRRGHQQCLVPSQGYLVFNRTHFVWTYLSIYLFEAGFT